MPPETSLFLLFAPVFNWSLINKYRHMFLGPLSIWNVTESLDIVVLGSLLKKTQLTCLALS